MHKEILPKRDAAFDQKPLKNTQKGEVPQFDLGDALGERCMNGTQLTKLERKQIQQKIQFPQQYLGFRCQI